MITDIYSGQMLGRYRFYRLIHKYYVREFGIRDVRYVNYRVVLVGETAICFLSNRAQETSCFISNSRNV